MQWEIFPLPKMVKTGTQHINLCNAAWVIIDADFSAVFTKHTIDFCRNLQQLFKHPLTVTRSFPEILNPPGMGQVLLVIKRFTTRGTGTDHYRIRVINNYLLLEAGSEAAAYYGLQTLHQLLSSAGLEFPEVEIEDYPDFPVRGVMLDISRCKVPQMTTLKNLTRLFSRLKYNQLQLYIEHTFAFSAHEVVWCDASPLSAEEILILDHYCREHYIELVPNFNSFGHFDRWLKHPAYKHLAESPGGFFRESGEWVPSGSTLMPDKASLAFLETLYREYLPNFTSKLFNAGLDETWELGKGRSKALCGEKGTISVYKEFLLEINKLVNRSGKRMLFWADIIIKEPGLLKGMPRDITACIWGYEATHPFMEQIKPFRDSGIDFYVCPGTSSWNAITGRTDNCLENIKQAAGHGSAAGARGCLVTDWGDNGHHQYLPISYPGFTAGAGYSWNSNSTEEPAVASAIDRIVFNGTAAGAGALLLELGRVHNGIPVKNPNETIINRLLFHTGADPGVLQGIAPGHLHNCLERLESLEDRFARIRQQNPAFALVKAEFINAVCMSRYAIRKGLQLLGEPAAEFRPVQELAHIIMLYEHLWLQRNRTGGLRESSDYLRKSMPV